MDIQAKIENGIIFSEYSPDLVAIFRSKGGKWDAAEKGWRFSPEQGSAVFEKLFGSGDIVTVRVPRCKTSEEADGYGMVGGYLLAFRKGRDYPARMAPGVELVSGSFSSSCGSRNHPGLGDSEDAVYRLQVYRSFAEREGLEIEEQEEPARTPVENSALSSVPDAELIAELTRRGYTINK